MRVVMVILLFGLGLALVGSGCSEEAQVECCPITESPCFPCCNQVGGTGPECGMVCDMSIESWTLEVNEDGCPYWDTHWP